MPTGQVSPHIIDIIKLVLGALTAVDASVNGGWTEAEDGSVPAFWLALPRAPPMDGAPASALACYGTCSGSHGWLCIHTA